MRRNLYHFVALLLLMLPLNQSFAQGWTGGTSGDELYALTSSMSTSGIKVGIGTVNPNFPLHVLGEASINSLVIGENSATPGAYGYFGKIHGKGNGNGNLYFAPRNINTSNGSFLSLGQRDSDSGKGDIRIVAGYYEQFDMYGKIILSTGGGMTPDVIVTENGDVGIGTPLTNNPENYKLAVMGKVGVYDDLVIENTSATWADYVFENDYQLLSLNQVEDYIKSNKHLPHVPSAREVKENGVNIVEMDATLLRKIEELTLYMIEMKKQNEALANKVKTLESKLNEVTKK